VVLVKYALTLEETDLSSTAKLLVYERIVVPKVREIKVRDCLKKGCSVVFGTLPRTRTTYPTDLSEKRGVGVLASVEP